MKVIHDVAKIIKGVSKWDYVFLCAEIYVFFMLQPRLIKKKLGSIRKRMKKSRENLEKDIVWTAARIFVFFMKSYQKFVASFITQRGSKNFHRPGISSVVIGIIVVIVLTPGIYFIEEAVTENLARTYGVTVSDTAPAREDPYQWLEGEQFFAHGMGQVEGLTITNSLEAFEFNYQEGYRVFEVDLTMTSDEVLVLRHENWRYEDNEEGMAQLTNEPMTYQKFRELKPGGTLTTLSFEDLAVIMERHPDVRIITDTKSEDWETVKIQFDQMTETVNKIDPALIKRITPQFYSEDMYRQLKEEYGFESYVYTLYLSDLDTGGIVEFMKENKLKILTIPEERAAEDFLADLEANEIYAGVHTVYTGQRYRELKDMGVDAFYTDTFHLEN